jgi:hypothetical protein
LVGQGCGTPLVDRCAAPVGASWRTGSSTPEAWSAPSSSWAPIPSEGPPGPGPLTDLRHPSVVR